VAAGFSLDLAVLERAHGVDAVELALRSATGGAVPSTGDARSAVVAQLRCTLPPGESGRIRGRLPGVEGGRAQAGGAEVVAVTGYEPGDRLDGWYDALLATVSAGADDVASAAGSVRQVLSDLPDAGVPHDGDEVRAVLDRLARGEERSGP
jgi:hypothetical protein